MARFNSKIKHILIVLAVFYCFEGSSQICTAVGPSSTIDSNVESVALIGEGGTFISFTGCPGVTGLDDQTLSQSADLLANSSYSVDVQFGTCGNNYSGAGEVWIDFNGNLTFEPSESIGQWSGIPPVAVETYNFTVPIASYNGSVRMRIVHQEGGTLPLNPCASYTWGSTIDFNINLSGGTATYCTNVGPSSTGDSNLQSLFIQGEGGSSIDWIGCPGVVGLDDQTATNSVLLSAGNSYDLDALFGSCNGSYPGIGQIWIDFGQDGVFDASDSVGSWQGTPPSAISSFNFTVPGGTAFGTSRMRVVHRESGTFPLDPCASFTWGSTTDFEVEFGAPVDCSGYVGDSLQDPRIVSAIPFNETYNNSVCYSNNVPVYNSPDVFYRLIPADYGVDYLNISLCGSTFDTYLQLMDEDGNVILSNDDYLYCSPQSEISISVAEYDTLYVVVQGWSNQSGEYSIAINDGAIVSTNEMEDDIQLYPNPTNGMIYLSGINEFSEISITNLDGQIIYNSTEFTTALDLQYLASGIYFVQITQGEKRFIKKIVLKP